MSRPAAGVATLLAGGLLVGGLLCALLLDSGQIVPAVALLSGGVLVGLVLLAGAVWNGLQRDPGRGRAESPWWP